VGTGLGTTTCVKKEFEAQGANLKDRDTL